MRAAEAPVSALTVPLLMQAINDPNGSVARVAEVVSSDAGLAARILAVANSAAFGLSRQVTDVRQATTLVGANMCQTLAIAGSCSLLDGTSGLPHVRDHAMATASAARFLAARSGLSKPDAFAAGLLHDLGEILLWRQDPDAYAAAHASCESADAQLRAERGMYGTDHALVAREQLAEWQLPGAVVDAVGDHHRPDMRFRDLSTLVVAAEELADPAVTESPRWAVFGVECHDVDSARTAIRTDVEELSGMLAAA